MLTDIEAAWVAGLMEGEGCFSIFKRKDRHYKAVHLQCTMTDEDVISRLLDIVKVGTVHTIQPAGVRKDGTPMKLAWKWSVQNHAGIEIVLKAILPFLGNRRKQKADEIMEYINSRKVLEIAN